MKINVLWIVVGGVLARSPAITADELKSGPPSGASIPGSFSVLTVAHAKTPDAIGKKWDHVEEYGANPVVMIFARTSGTSLAKLLKSIDAEVAGHKAGNKRVHALLVALSDDDGREQALKDFGEKHGLKHVSLSVAAAGPHGWDIAEDADVTVVLYNRRTVRATHAFRVGSLNEKATGPVIADLSRVVGK